MQACTPGPAIHVVKITVRNLFYRSTESCHSSPQENYESGKLVDENGWSNPVPSLLKQVK